MESEQQKQQASEQVSQVEAIFSRIEKDLPAPKFYGLDNKPDHDKVKGKINQDLTYICERWNRIGSALDNCGVHLFAQGKDLATITKKRYVTTMIDDNFGQVSVTNLCDTTNFAVTSAAWQKHPDLVTTIEVSQENPNQQVTKTIEVHHANAETAAAVIAKIYAAVVLDKPLTTDQDQVKKLRKLNIATKILGLINPERTPNAGREL